MVVAQTEEEALAEEAMVVEARASGGGSAQAAEGSAKVAEARRRWRGLAQVVEGSAQVVEAMAAEEMARVVAARRRR